MMRRLAVLAVLSLVAGCGNATVGSGTPNAPTSQPRESGLLVGSGIVLDDGDGPEFCLGAVAESYPPQCGGPKVVGWDWADMPDAESAAGTTWTGGVVLTGTYDGDVFTLKRLPVPVDEYDGPLPAGPYGADVSLTTPCPEPAGGWRPVDAARTNQRTFQEAVRVADALEGFGELWVDQSINASDNEMDMNDPRRLILNVSVVGDLAAAELRLREVWGGALCVSAAQRSSADLRRIHAEIGSVEGMLTSGYGRGVVDLGVLYDDGSLQRRLDDEYGPGVVRVHSALMPLPDSAK